MAWSRASIRVLVYVCAGAGAGAGPGLVCWAPLASVERAHADAGAPTASLAAAQAEPQASEEQACNLALARLKASDPGERAHAADELSQRGGRFRQPISAALRPLLRADPSSLVRAAAGRALGRLGVRDALPELVSALEDTSVEVRVVAAAALWRLPDPSAVPALLARTEDQDQAVREWSALALGVAADPRALPVLTRLLDDPERAVRLAAVRSLGRLGQSDGLEPLLQYLKTGQRDDEEKDEVVNAMVSVAGSAREQALLRALTAASSDPRQRVRLLVALAKVGDEPSVPTLRKLVTRDGTPAVRSAAKQALTAVQDRLRGVTHASVHDAARP